MNQLMQCHTCLCVVNHTLQAGWSLQLQHQALDKTRYALERQEASLTVLSQSLVDDEIKYCTSGCALIFTSLVENEVDVS